MVIANWTLQSVLAFLKSGQLVSKCLNSSLVKVRFCDGFILSTWKDNIVLPVMFVVYKKAEYSG